MQETQEVEFESPLHGKYELESFLSWQLRMKCSKLNFDLLSQHVDSPVCACGHNREDSNHYLSQCPLYFQARNKMLNEIRQLNTFQISGDLSLYGAAELNYSMSLIVKYLMLSMVIIGNWQTVMSLLWIVVAYIVICDVYDIVKYFIIPTCDCDPIRIIKTVKIQAVVFVLLFHISHKYTTSKTVIVPTAIGTS